MVIIGMVTLLLNVINGKKKIDDWLLSLIDHHK